MAKYSVKITGTTSTTVGIGAVATSSSGTPRRLKLYDLNIGCTGTPADASLTWDLVRWTTTGSTHTSSTPTALDSADAAALFAGWSGGSGDGTGTAVALTIPLHQRATFRWIAAPGGEIVVPASTGNGIGFESPAISTGTPTAAVGVHVEEQ